MNKEEKKLITTYLKANIKRPDDWISPPNIKFTLSRASIKNYILRILQSHIERNEAKSEKLTAIKNFYSDKVWTNLEELKKNIDNDSTICIENFFSKKKNIQEPSLRVIEFVTYLFDIKIPNSFLEENYNIVIQKCIREQYLQNPEFTQIQIIGDVNMQIKTLSIDDYYIDLSYIGSEEIKSRDSLNLKEKESSQRVISRSSIPHQYISESIITEGTRTVIMGNPGTGKSTFAKWLCSNWAKKESSLDSTMVHISLRKLDLHNKDNCIIKYIYKEYIDKDKGLIKSGDIESFLQQTGTILILDGLDELEDDLKVKLYQDVQTTSKIQDYILLSRPYGLMGNPFNQNAAIEILGFNDDSRFNYLTKYFAKIGIGQPTGLLKIIKENPILEDLSYNPLMLSYVLLLYKLEGNSEESLINIESTFELQLKVFGWFKHYYEKADIIRKKKFEELTVKTEEFAYFMEINQQFIYYSKNIPDKYSIPAENLNNMGIGRKEDNTNASNWKYYFTSITFQEFLAAKHIGNFITPEAFIYISMNQIFWNYSKMILGYKAYMGEELFIDNVFSILESKFSETDKSFFKFYYILLYGEINPQQLNKKITNEVINDLFSYYNTAYTDPNWESLLLDAISRVYSKLNKENQSEFINRTILQVENHTKNPKKWGSDPKAHSLFKLIIKVRLFNNLYFVGKLLKLTIKTIDNFGLQCNGDIENFMYYADITEEEKNKINNISDILDNIYTVFEYISSEMAQYYKDQIIELEKKTQLIYQDKYIRMAIFNQDEITVNHELNTTLIKINEGGISDSFEEDLEALAMKMYQYSFYYRNSNDFTKQKTVEKIIEIQGIIEETIVNIQEDDSKKNIINWLFAAYNDLNFDYFYYSLKILQRYDLVEYIKVKNANKFIEYLDSLSGDYERTKEDQKINHLFLVALKCSKIGEYSINKYKEVLFKSFKNLIVNNHEEYNLLSKSRVGKIESPAYLSVNKMTEFFRDNNYNQRSFLDKILSSSQLMKNDYVRCIIIPDLFRLPIVIQEYKDLLYDLSEKDRVFSFLRHKELYYYPENIKHIEHIFLLKTRLHVLECFFYLSTVQQYKLDLNFVVMKHIKKTILIKISSKEFKYNELELYLSRLLFYKLTNDDDVLCQLSSDKKIDKYCSRMDLISEFFKLFDVLELRDFKGIIEGGLYKEFEKYIQNMNITNSPFKKEEFEKLLVPV